MRKAGRFATTGQPPKARFLFWISAGIIAFLLGSAWLGEDGYLAVIAAKARVSKLEKEIEAIEDKNKELRSEIRSLRSDERAIEKIAREDLGLVKKGEIVYEFIPSRK